jgi:hypothetical protein
MPWYPGYIDSAMLKKATPYQGHINCVSETTNKTPPHKRPQDRAKFFTESIF